MTTDAPDTPGGERPSRHRASIAERAARRQYLETHGRDRYDSLLRHLRAGQEIPIERKGRLALEWHPIANKLILGFLLVVAVYFVATTITSQIREQRVDTWAGSGPTVQSGMRLESCPALVRRNDPVFPNWIRMDGKVFQPRNAQLPIGETNIGKYYIDSGYTLDGLRIYRVTLTGLGEPGSRIIVRAGEAPAAELYGAIPGCS